MKTFNTWAERKNNNFKTFQNSIFVVFFGSKTFCFSSATVVSIDLLVSQSALAFWPNFYQVF
jgi:hypothetical protein